MSGSDVGKSAEAELDSIQRMLSIAHQRSHSRPIVGPDSDGVFPETYGLGWLGLGSNVPPIVPDTNVLSRDLGRVHKHGKRTVLLNTANSGAIRLLCPVHVIKEMLEHAPDFSEQMRMSVDEYLHIWQSDYVPLLRVIDDLPPGLWTTEEEVRLEALQAIDPDDVPAARLAIAVGAVFLSKDGEALKAVYGEPVDKASRDRWVGTLMDGGDLRELGSALEGGALLIRLVGMSAVGVRRGIRTSGAAAVLLSAGVTAALASYVAANSQSRQRIHASASRLGSAALSVVDRYFTASAELSARAAPAPSSDAVEKSMTEVARLTRACLSAFARGSSSTYSAVELRHRLGPLDFPSGDAKVRALLREFSCFFEVHPGRFQLGRPAAQVWGVARQWHGTTWG